jgi:hypothetical protein
MKNLIIAGLLLVSSVSYAAFPDVPSAQETGKVSKEARAEALKQEIQELGNKVESAIVERSNKGLNSVEVSIWGYSTEAERTVEKVFKDKGYHLAVGHPFKLFVTWK